MNDLAVLSLELQLLLVGGYLAYKTSTIGTQVKEATEEFVLKVLAFGVTGALAYQALSYLLALGPLSVDQHLNLPLAKGLGVVVICVLLGIVWRRWASRWVARILNRMRVHKDDHFQTTWDSMVHEPAVWDYLQIHLNNGKVLESDFRLVANEAPMGRLRLSEDGIAMYVTRIHGDDAKEAPTYAEGRGYILTYVPRDQVAQIELCWRPIS